MELARDVSFAKFDLQSRQSATGPTADIGTASNHDLRLQFETQMENLRPELVEVTAVSGMNFSDLVVKPKRAVQYVRMSTEHQQHSILNQAAAIGRYAKERGYTLVRSYPDHGIRGLTLASRPALRQLLHDVCSGSADFEAVLVYDISRWGRFQDTDESAHYEFMCRQMGVDLHYCAEQFENDGSIAAALLKSVKRVMAAEFSRELSAKVYAGQARVARQGFMTQGSVPLGLSKQLVSKDGVSKGILPRGESKHLHSDRVILVPGRQRDIGTIHKIFEMYVQGGKERRRLLTSSID